MSDTDIATMPSETDSIVLGAAENEARRHGLRLSAPAKDFLLARSVSSLDAIRASGQLNKKRTEIEDNTTKLIKYIVENAKPGSLVGEISYQDLVQGLSLFCRLFPHFIPFCVNAE
jgi:hypothetical protein